MQVILSFFLILISSVSFASSRIKDITAIESIRNNFLVGQGLVVGLNGTGDNLKNSVFTHKELTNLLERLKVNIYGEQLKTRNIATVAVTAKLPPFARQGATIDVKVSALGDATSLKNGTLLPTPLVGPDGTPYAIAHGTVVVSEFVPISDNVKTKNNGIETNGFVQNGAIIENEVNFKFSSLENIKFSLHSPDFSTAALLAEVINNNIEGNTATVLDPGTIQVAIPYYRKNDMVEFIAEIEQLTVSPDSRAKIIVDQATSTVVIGNDVQVRPIAIAQGNLVVNVGNKMKNIEDVMYLLSEKKQQSINQAIDSNRGKVVRQLDHGTKLSELVEGLNKLGVLPRDIINILYNIKSVGALDAVIEVQ